MNKVKDSKVLTQDELDYLLGTSDTNPVNMEIIKLLTNVKKIVCEDRQADYGDKTLNFHRIAEYWRVFLDNKIDNKVTPADVAAMMMLMKLARLQYKYKEDTCIDLIGYAVICASLAKREYNDCTGNVTE